jgi:hypothetical protein
MAESLVSLEESLTALDSDKLNPDEINTAYNEIVSIIDDLSNIITGGTSPSSTSSSSYPSSSSSPSLLTDDSLVNIDGLDKSTTYINVINQLSVKNKIQNTK